MKALADFCAATSDRGDTDIRMGGRGKDGNTEVGWDLIDTALQFKGGRGYETAASLEQRGEVASPIERAFRDARINRIVAGTTDVMHLFSHASRSTSTSAWPVCCSHRGRARREAQALVVCVLLRTLVPMLWLGGLFSFSQFDDDPAEHMRWIESRTRKLARKLFHAMVLNGPAGMKQLTLARVVDIGTEQRSGGAHRVARSDRAEQRRCEQQHRAIYWLETGLIRVDSLFSALGRNADATARKLAQEMMAEAELLTPEAVELTPIPDERGSDHHQWPAGQAPVLWRNRLTGDRASLEVKPAARRSM